MVIYHKKNICITKQLRPTQTREGLWKTLPTIKNLWFN